MRWDNLFHDLEAQLEHELALDEIDVSAEDERLRIARLDVRDRLLALSRAADRPVVTVFLDTEEAVRVSIETLGRDWLSGMVVAEGPRRRAIIPLAAVTSLAITDGDINTSLKADARPAHVTERLGVAFVLRDLCRRRSPVDMRTRASTIHGTIDRVGRDHCDVAVHAAGTYRRARNVSQFRIVTFSSLISVTAAA